MGTLIKNGEIVTAADRYVADLYLEDGVIQAIGRKLDARAGDKVIDAAGLFVFPGGVDAHTHLDMPFMGTTSADDFETGSIAAAVGGTTSVVDFVIPGRGQPLLEALEDWHKKGKKSVFDYAFHMAVTHYSEAVRKEIEVCVREKGITSFKTFMAYKGALGIDDLELFNVMETAKSLGAMVTVHAEHADLVDSLVARHIAQGKVHPRFHAQSRPPEVEGEATSRALTLAKVTQEQVYVVHMTCKHSVDALAAARQAGQVAYGETCPQYLLLDETRYDEPDFGGAKYVMSPPLRAKEHQEVLWAALRSGIIQTVATDHCPFTLGQKAAGKDNFAKIPNGAPGIENRMALMYTYGVLEGRISLHKFVDICSTQPARLFGMTNKGSIGIGLDADLVLWDPAAQGVISAKTHHQRVDYNAFEGFKTQGRAEYVFVNGRLVVEANQYVGERGGGRYVHRAVQTPGRLPPKKAAA
jgi:dihydropyrimidinase